MTEEPSRGLSASTLKIVAMVSMALDHSWIALGRPGVWMHLLGRLAFPIYCFLLVEGFFHTHSRKKYALRLLEFGILSELPFNLLCSGHWFYPGHQNVMFTLLLELGAVTLAQKAREGRHPRENAGGAIAMVILAAFLAVDYGEAGVLTILLFWATREWGWKGRLAQLVGMLYINAALLGSYLIPVGQVVFPAQVAALLALPLLWLYQGKPGIRSRAFRMGAYWFYPLHLLALGLLSLAV